MFVEDTRVVDIPTALQRVLAIWLSQEMITGQNPGSQSERRDIETTTRAKTVGKRYSGCLVSRTMSKVEVTNIN